MKRGTGLALGSLITLGWALTPLSTPRQAGAGDLAYSTYLGGGSDDYSRGIAVDTAGSAYVTGMTYSQDFPTKSAYQPTFVGSPGALECFVTKLAPSGSSIVYSTYVGGGNGSRGYGISVDLSGSAYIVGETNSSDFPVVNGYQPTFGGGQSDAFLLKLAPSGSSLEYSSYLGGSGWDMAYSTAVDIVLGTAYLTGETSSPNFPVQGAYQATLAEWSGSGVDAFVTKLSPSGGNLTYSTYLGGGGPGGLDHGQSIALDSSGSAFVAGWTRSSSFPVKTAYQASLGGGGTYSFDAFVTKLSPSGSSLAYSTYLGGQGDDDRGYGIAVDSAGNAYVVGSTMSTDFPVLNAYQPSRGGSSDDAFVTKLAQAGSSLVFSTYLGGDANNTDVGSAIAVDPDGNVYVTGETCTPDFPMAAPYQGALRGDCDAYLSKLRPSGNSLFESTYLGGGAVEAGYGVALDSSGRAYVVGVTNSTDFPVKDAYQSSGTQGDVFVARFVRGAILRGAADVNGDLADDVGVFRNGMWFFTDSPDFAGVDHVVAFGSPTAGADAPEIGEFSCVAVGGGHPDGRVDLGIFRKAFSTWQVALSPLWSAPPGLSVTFGTTSHKRIPTRRLDTNGDGCSDIGAFRDGCFDVVESPGYAAVAKHACFGLGTDQPLAAELNGDGMSDLLLWRAGSAHYSYRLSPLYAADFGADLGAGDLPIVGELNGDGRADLGSYKQSASTFRFTYSPDFIGVDLTRTHGMSGDVPIVADMNGDGRSDFGIFRNAIARWWFLCSPAWSSTCLSTSFGSSGDVPIYGKPPGMP